VKQLIALMDGTVVEVDRDDVDEPYGMRGPIDVGGAYEDVVAFITERLTSLGRAIGDIREDLAQVKLAEVTVELGVAIEAAGGVPALAKLRGDCHMTVRAKWQLGGGGD
jgi:hypothetical protein